MLRIELVMARDLDKRVQELDKLKYKLDAIVHVSTHELNHEFQFKIFYRDNYDPSDDDIPF